MRSILDLMAKVQVQPNGCWNYTGFIGRNGYGRAYLANWGEDGAHKVSYMLHFGPVPKGQDVCHTCDNRKCVNPTHLWVGTRSANIMDAVAKDRMPQMTECYPVRKPRNHF